MAGPTSLSPATHSTRAPTSAPSKKASPSTQSSRHLYHNDRDGTFTDVTSAVHLDRAILTMGANFGDLNNDGFLDIYLGTGDSTYQALLPNRMFLNAADPNGTRDFKDVTTAGDFGHLQKGSRHRLR